MKKIIKFIKNYTFCFILGVLLFGVVGVYAASKIYATSVSIDTSNINDLSSGATLDTALTDLYKKRYSTTCPAGYKCFEKKSTPEVGDYVRMTPTKTSFTTDTSKTGYTSTQTINPSQLNMWRVIRVNSNGTIEMISENITDFMINFQGKVGYKNYVGYLNVLASQYENSTYTIGSRHIGYNGQTEFLTDTATTIDTTSNIPPWTSSSHNLYGTSHGNAYESKGGGDNLYTSDINLVKNALGSLYAKSKSGDDYGYYCLSSRFYYGYDNSWNIGFYLLFTSNEEAGLANPIYAYNYDGSIYDNYNYCHLRPIVTLKSGISYTPALGTSDDPFVLS